MRARACTSGASACRAKAPVCSSSHGLFSTTASGAWLLQSDAKSFDLLPHGEIARTDPFLVLPPLEDAGITWGWGVKRPE